MRATISLFVLLLGSMMVFFVVQTMFHHRQNKEIGSLERVQNNLKNLLSRVYFVGNSQRSERNLSYKEQTR